MFVFLMWKKFVCAGLQLSGFYEASANTSQASKDVLKAFFECQLSENRVQKAWEKAFWVIYFSTSCSKKFPLMVRMKWAGLIEATRRYRKKTSWKQLAGDYFLQIFDDGYFDLKRSWTKVFFCHHKMLNLNSWKRLKYMATKYSKFF